MADDHTALDLYRTHRPALIDYARTIVGDHARAEDAVQDAWLRFAGSMSAGRVREPVQYLYRIVRNLALDGRRRRLAERLREATGKQIDTVADEQPDQEQAAAARSEIAFILQALRELPDRTRIAVEMHRLGGHTLTEIAAHLKISVGLAHALVAEGIKHCHRRRMDAR